MSSIEKTSDYFNTAIDSVRFPANARPIANSLTDGHSRIFNKIDVLSEKLQDITYMQTRGAGELN